MDDDFRNYSLSHHSRQMRRHHLAIRSTGAAAKVFFCQMLVGRLVAMNIRREATLREIGYEDVAIKDLPSDVTHCIICQVENLLLITGRTLY
jgi:hypothetical protein